ncbi:stage V sporulation protein AC [uncultured Clostridium sp.]|uniref:stage V sporulation protein AC n=1 Tax=uncultured Clostridium sp. TaxID=59620 RepID=UPI002628BFB8|nr:stage V sporulation protein AC [uncultured Clostridium sp.]
MKLTRREKRIKKRFDKLAKETSPKPKIIRNCIRAFLVGGLICTLGEGIGNIIVKFGVSSDNKGVVVSIIMIFLGALLTGVGVYDKIATFAGAGSVVPITGFANAVVAPAIEYKKEGFVFGVAAKIFMIAGPVLVYGIGVSVIIGIVYYIIGMV